MKAKMRLGFAVFGVLMAIEVIEFVVGSGVQRGAWPYLVLLAIVGAWPIVQHFMHIAHLWRPEE